MASPSTLSEADIFAEVVGPANLNAEAARSLLDLKFTAKAQRRIRQLLQKNNRGAISARERSALGRYLQVGQLLDLLHARAKLSLDQLDGER